MEHGKLTKLLTSGPCRAFAPQLKMCCWFCNAQQGLNLCCQESSLDTMERLT